MRSIHHEKCELCGAAGQAHDSALAALMSCDSVGWCRIVEKTSGRPRLLWVCGECAVAHANSSNHDHYQQQAVYV